jgi:hypothetical protein
MPFPGAVPFPASIHPDLSVSSANLLTIRMAAGARAAVLLALALAPAAHAQPPTAPPPAPPKAPPPEWYVTQGDWTLTISAEGDITGLEDRAGRRLVRRDAGDNLVRVGVVPHGRTPGEVDPDDLVVCRAPAKAERKEDGGDFEYALAPRLPFRLRVEIRFESAGGFPAVRRTVSLVPDAPPFASDVLVVAGHAFALDDPARRVFTPTRAGFGEELANAPGRQWLWALNGEGRIGPGPVERLALPLVSEAAAGAPPRITTFADPSFATAFRLADPPSRAPGEASWVYNGTRVPLQEAEVRTLWTVVHPGGADEALAVWSAAALAGVPPGPAWLHDVALVHVDFMSRGGRGWFDDIDALERLVPAADRAKVLCVQHGWYDAVGRYAYDEKAGRLDDAWTALPGGAGKVAMTKAELAARLAYARRRGFRAGLAFAEGMAACDGVKDLVAPDLVLGRSNRAGPDQVGRACVLNPGHARVRTRFLGYLRALLEDCGKATDALVWFGTSDVGEGAVSPGEAPGYAARAMMRLVRDCAAEASRVRPTLALLAGDAPGSGPPYAMMAHGCCTTAAGPGDVAGGLFPNLRNVLWAVPRGAPFAPGALRDASESFGLPAASSAGWGDGGGIADLPDAEREALLAVFRARAARPQRLAWLRGPAPGGR